MRARSGRRRRRWTCTPVAQMMRRAGALGWPGLATTSFAPLDAGGRSRRPRSVAATAGVRLGMRGGRKGVASIGCTCRPPVQSPGRPMIGKPFRAPAARRPSPRPRAGGRDARGAEGTGSMVCTEPTGDDHFRCEVSRNDGESGGSLAFQAADSSFNPCTDRTLLPQPWQLLSALRCVARESFPRAR